MENTSPFYSHLNQENETPAIDDFRPTTRLNVTQKDLLALEGPVDLPIPKKTFETNLEQVAEGSIGGSHATMSARTLATLRKNFEPQLSHVPSEERPTVTPKKQPDAMPVKDFNLMRVAAAIEAEKQDELTKPWLTAKNFKGVSSLLLLVPAVFVYIGLVAGTGILTALGSVLDLNDMDKHPILFKVGFVLKSIPNIPAWISENIIAEAVTYLGGSEKGKNWKEEMTVLRQFCIYGRQFANKELDERHKLRKQSNKTPTVIDKN